MSAAAIREFTAKDYDALGALVAAVFPDYPGYAVGLRHRDETRDPRCQMRRWLAWVGEGALGLAEYSQEITRHHPRKYWLELVVDPAAEGQGLGRRLFATLMEALLTLDPLTLWTNVREDKERGLRFAANCGFRETMRAWESHFHPRSFQPGPWQAALDRVASQGISIRAWPGLDGVADRKRRLHELRALVHPDIPATTERTPEDFADFEGRYFSDPMFDPRACFVALDGERFVGYCNLYRNPADPTLYYTGVTGVRREYRRRGIAMALKVVSLAWARDSGVEKVETWNDDSNRGMLAINEKLGFERHLAWITHEKRIAEE